MFDRCIVPVRTLASVWLAGVLTCACSANPPAPTKTAAIAPAAFLQGKTEPVAGDTVASYTDTRLKLTFDLAPVLGRTGTIKIFRASDDKLVDVLDIGGGNVPANDIQTIISKVNMEVEALGPAADSTYRHVFYKPVLISGKVATIVPHNGKLQAETAYYVTVDAGVFAGNVGGKAFAGIGKQDGWSFTTRKLPVAGTLAVTVDDDGPADFRSVQGALNFMMATAHTGSDYASQDKTITIKNGKYEELLFLRGVNNLTLRGESRDGVVVQYDNSESYNPGTGNSAGEKSGNATVWKDAKSGAEVTKRASLGGGRAVFMVNGTADMLTLTDFTLKNSHVKETLLPASNVKMANQAEALFYASSNRLVAVHMNFLSAQDTLQLKGYSWFYQSLIAGDVDFIWGYSFASLFEESEIRTVVDTTNAALGGYIVQARAYYGYPGYVFLNSRLTREAGVPDGATVLARSGGAACNGKGGYNCDMVAYINTKMDSHIALGGWHTKPLPNIWSGASPVAECVDKVCNGWWEFGSQNLQGKVLDLSPRVAQGNTMSSAAQSAGYATRAQIFSSFNNNAGWNPQVPATK